jgi:hypothetical protein
MGRPGDAKAGPAIFPRPWEDESPAARGGPQAAESTSGAEAGPSGTSARLGHWWWAIPGLVVGAALALAASRPTGAWREPGLRQELLDR